MSILSDCQAKITELTAKEYDWQTQVNREVYYRNLAIYLGARPEWMQGSFDRKLCETFGQEGKEVVEYQINDNHETWQELETYKNQNTSLLEEIHKWREVAEYYLGEYADTATPEECRKEAFKRTPIKVGFERDLGG